MMVLTCRDIARLRVVQLPPDVERHEAFRHATGVIAQVEENTPGHSWDDIEEALEDHGFIPLDHLLGPELD